MNTKRNGHNRRASRLLRENADRSILQLVAQFEPQIGFTKKLPNVAESVNKKVHSSLWNVGPTSVTIRHPEKQFFYHFDHQTAFLQTLGLDPWISDEPGHLEALNTSFNKMDVSRLRLLTLKITTQLSLSMLHVELTELVLEGYLTRLDDLKASHGDLNDILLQIYGMRNGMKSQTSILPQSAEQAKSTFLAAGNLDLFVENKYVDSRVHEHMKRVSMDCLTLIIELSKPDVPVVSVPAFAGEAFDWAETIVEDTVSRVKGLRISGGRRDGDSELTG